MIKDYFGKCGDTLLNKKLFLFDMDGTIYNENTVFDGTLDLLAYIDKIGGKYIFVTNNSSKSVDDYVQKVNKMGIKSDKNNFYTSTQCTAMYLLDHFGQKLIFASGTKSFIKELKEFGLNITEEVNNDAAAIVMGYDTELNYQKLINLCLMLKNDVPYIATNPDFVCPCSFGYVPDCGSVSIMLKNATGREPMFIGKPEPTMIEYVVKTLGYKKEETVLLGDRIYTDIASGLNAGVTTILVLSGEATLDDYEKDKRKPDFVFENVRDLCDKLNKENNK